MYLKPSIGQFHQTTESQRILPDCLFVQFVFGFSSLQTKFGEILQIPAYLE